MKLAMTKDEFKNIFHIKSEGTVRNYIREGILKSIGNNKIIFDRQRVFRKLGLANEPNEPFVTMGDVRKMFGIKDKWKSDTNQYVKYHKIPHYKFIKNKGSQTYFLRSELEKCLLAKESGVEFEYIKLVNGKNTSMITKFIDKRKHFHNNGARKKN